MTFAKSGVTSVSNELFSVYPTIISFSSPRNVMVGLASSFGCFMIIPISVVDIWLLFARLIMASSNVVFVVSIVVVVPSTRRLPFI